MTWSAQGTMPIVVALVLALVLALVALLPRAEVRHPLVSLVRVLVPSWRFFDDLQVTPTLLVRVARIGGTYGEWTPVLSPPQRSIVHLVWNPAGNLVLAQQSLLERLLMDVGEWDERDAVGPEALVSYELVLNLVRARLAADGVRHVTCQFKLVESSGEGGEGGSDLMISREHAA